MKLTILLALTWAFSGGYPKTPNSKLIDRLDQKIQARFAAPPQELGMSRVAMPRSFGGHFLPIPGAATDFRADTPDEQSVIRELTAGSVSVGFYVFGAAIEHSAPELHDFRALKGPAVATAVTIRSAIPDWKTVYPIAREAMKSFERGAGTLEASAGDWHMVARPVPASSASCIGCHNNPLIGRAGHPILMNNAIGGVLYLYR
jgi:hypothetical protein